MSNLKLTRQSTVLESANRLLTESCKCFLVSLHLSGEGRMRYFLKISSKLMDEIITHTYQNIGVNFWCTSVSIFPLEKRRYVDKGLQMGALIRDSKSVWRELENFLAIMLIQYLNHQHNIYRRDKILKA